MNKELSEYCGAPVKEWRRKHTCEVDKNNFANCGCSTYESICSKCDKPCSLAPKKKNLNKEVFNSLPLIDFIRTEKEKSRKETIRELDKIYNALCEEKVKAERERCIEAVENFNIKAEPVMDLKGVKFRDTATATKELVRRACDERQEIVVNKILTALKHQEKDE